MCSKWTEDTTVQFVELYREEECLWNAQLVTYRNRQARESAIKRMVEAMGIEDFGPTEVKTKTKNLRSTYAQEVAKIKKTQSSGAGTDEIHKPKMQWFSVMHTFLHTKEKRRKTCSNLASYLCDVGDESRPQVQNSQISQDDIDEITYEEVPSAGEVTEQNVNEDVTKPPPKRHKAAKPKVKEVATCTEHLNSLTTSIQSIGSMGPIENEFDIFGKSVAAQLKQLSLSEAIIAQDLIQQILTSFRLAHIVGLSTSGCSSNCSNTIRTCTSPQSDVILFSPQSDDPLRSPQSDVIVFPPQSHEILTDNSTRNILVQAYAAVDDGATDQMT